jgi:glucosamine-6-phosphate deaminase
MKIILNNKEYPVRTEDSTTLRDIEKLLPLTMEFRRSGDVEFVSELPVKPVNDGRQISKTAENGIYYYAGWNVFCLNYRAADISPWTITYLGMTDDPEGECARYEEKIASYGGIDLFMGGIGVDGHLAFNEPYTSLSSRTGVRALTTDTIIVNSRFFDNDPSKVPTHALSVGIGTVTDSKEVLVLISGHNKARALAATVEGGVSQKWTCSALQMHNAAIIACDEEACGELTVDTYKYFLDIEKKERL